MVIPSGKKFQFRTKFGTNPKFFVPAIGYKGQAMSTTPISLNMVNHYGKPLEGVLDRMPHIADTLLMATNNVSLRNNKFASMKYWTGTDPMEINFSFKLETQVDSFYDVYMPALHLVEIASPSETELGFFSPPSPTLKLIAETAGKTFNKKGDDGENTKVFGEFELDVGSKTFKGSPDNFIHGVVDTLQNIKFADGYRTDLLLGDNFQFTDILIKNLNITYSQETCYAPFYWLNNVFNARKGEKYNKIWEDMIEHFKNSKDDKYESARDKLRDMNLSKFTFNPYSLSKTLVMTYAQTIGAALALGTNLVDFFKQVGSLFGGFNFNMDKSMSDAIENATKDSKGIPSFPISATVDMAIELQFPITKMNQLNSSEKSSTGLQTIMKSDKINNFGY